MPVITTNPTRAAEKIILALSETTYGTDAGPTAAAALRCWDWSANPMEADERELAYASPYMGSKPSRLTNMRTTASCKIGLIGAGATSASLIPLWDPIARCLGMTRVVTPKTAAATIAAAAGAGVGAHGVFTYTRTTAFAGTADRTATLTCTTGGGSGVAAFTVSAPATGPVDAYTMAGVMLTIAQPFALPDGAVITPQTVTTPFQDGDTFTIALAAPGASYLPSSDRDGHGSATLYYMLGRERHVMVGTRGTAKLVLPHDDVPYFDVSLTSLFTLPGAVAPPTPDYSAWTDPKATSTENTPIRRFFGNDHVLQEATIDIGNTVSPVLRMGRSAIRINERKSTCMATIEAPDLADFDYWARAFDRTTGPATLQHGTATGEIIRFDAPSLQLGRPVQKEADGDYMLDLSGKLLPVQGDDEWAIHVR